MFVQSFEAMTRSTGNEEHYTKNDNQDFLENLKCIMPETTPRKVAAGQCCGYTPDITCILKY